MVRRIACWPDDRHNPYQRLFYAALGAQGIEQVHGLIINDDELLRLRPSIDAIHLHWPEYVWRIETASPAGRIRRIAGFHTFLRRCHELELRIIWTAHNLQAHDGTWIDRFGLWTMARQSDLIIAHTERVAAIMRRNVRARVVVMPHGNYDGALPPPTGQASLIKELGLSTTVPTLSLVGALRPYKGTDRAIEAVAQLQGRVQLIVAGTPKSGFNLEALESRARSEPWLACLTRPLSDQEFVDVISASTAVLLPYTRMTTSGVLLAAWTLGRGAITSPEPYFEDLLALHPLAGRAAVTDTAEDLSAAIHAYLSLPQQQRWSEARKAADAYPWTRCILPVVEALRSL
jgi:glycosyltransferase involved in cell wall biosynthesis